MHVSFGSRLINLESTQLLFYFIGSVLYLLSYISVKILHGSCPDAESVVKRLSSSTGEAEGEAAKQYGQDGKAAVA